MTRHVAVLMGGQSAEREVSLSSGDACARALRDKGFRVSEVDAGQNLALDLDRLRPDVCFNALHGRFGEDGCVQGLLEVLRIPYTHSGVTASAIAMDKALAKRLFSAAGLRCTDGLVVPTAEINARDPLQRPYVVKPVREGSTFGVRIVEPGDNRPPIDSDWRYGEQALVEPYVPGRELTVGVMGDRPLAVTDIVTNTAIFDYRSKYTAGFATHVLPADIPSAVYDLAMESALTAHRTLGCSGVSRCDFRFDERHGAAGLHLLEINTQPGMTGISLVPEQAAHCGISFGDLVAWLVEEARCHA
ncbi:MAG: D-alanine--D-alanine ligase [Alphaproteobacteria bacterium]